MITKVFTIILCSLLFLAIACKKDNNSTNNSQYITPPKIILKMTKPSNMGIEFSLC